MRKIVQIRSLCLLNILCMILVTICTCHLVEQEEREINNEVNNLLGVRSREEKNKDGYNDEPPPPLSPSSPSPSPRNIVVLLADDLGYGDLSYSGHPTSRTPNIDKLAEGSRFFTHHYVTSPVCSPSRASLLTGRLQVRSGVYPGTFVPENTFGLPSNETTLAALLKTKGTGYQTMITGKWHLGVGSKAEYLPTHYGFDHYLGIPYSHDMCPCHICFPAGNRNQSCYDTCWHDRVSCPLYSNDTIIEQPVDLLSLTHRLVKAAVDFITTSAASGKPFFLYFPFFHVHHPQFASETFSGKSIRGTIGDSLYELDWAVGEVVKALQKHNLINSTLIWFSSDNGPSLTRHERGGSAGVLRCGKGTTWEGGVRVPMFVHYPPFISPGRSDGLVSALDLIPTMASLFGFNTSGLVLDGVDISPLLLNPNAESPRGFMPIYPESPTPDKGPFAMTNGQYKAHFYTKGSSLSDDDNYDSMCRSTHSLTKHDPPLLYNIHHDPGERYDLSGDPKYSDILSNLTSLRRHHMQNLTWGIGLTQYTNTRDQPCCTESSCNPFPECCDCHHNPYIATLSLSPHKHPNHIYYNPHV